MDSRIQSYLRESISTMHAWREVTQIGPFLASFNRMSEIPYLNYAVPDDAAVPSPDDVAALVDAFVTRSRLPRLEYLPSTAPEVEAALLAGGFDAGARLPLMTCTADSLRTDVSTPADIEIVEPTTDVDFAGMVVVTKEAYGEDNVVAVATPDEVAERRHLVASGGFAVLARDKRSGAAAGSAICPAPHDSITELATVGVRHAYRRRGVAAAVAAGLARLAIARGVEILWLTPEHDYTERAYATVGFRTTSEVLHIACRRFQADS